MKNVVSGGNSFQLSSVDPEGANAVLRLRGPGKMLVSIALMAAGAVVVSLWEMPSIASFFSRISSSSSKTRKQRSTPPNSDLQRISAGCDDTDSHLFATRIFSYFNPFGRTKPELRGTVLESKTQSGQRFCVYLPPGHGDGAMFPILYHLHGAGSDPSCVKKDVSQIALQNESEKMQPVIVVAPYDPSLWSMWADGQNIKMASRVIDDLIPYVEATFSVQESERYLQGFSMGGFGAATMAFRHQKLFKKLVVWDGALHDWDTLTQNRPSIAKKQFAMSQDAFELFSPWAATTEAAQNGTLRNTPILMYSGKMAATRSYSARFQAHLDKLGANVTHIVTSIPHSMENFTAAHGQDAFSFLLRS